MPQSVYYLDYAAATPLDERVLSAMLPYFTDKFYNPSSPYLPAVDVRRDYADAKTAIARAIGASADELVMTAGATESINIAINSFAGHKICPSIEHDSVRNAIKKSGDFTFVAPESTGRIDPAHLVQAIRDDTTLVSVALANHEIGTLQPIADIARALEDVRKLRAAQGNKTPLLFHCDASQGFGLVDIHAKRLGVDLLTLNAAKIYGPKQVGLLWIRPGVVVAPTIVGGGQELGLRSGTENVAGVIGFAEAVRQSVKKRQAEVKRLADLRDKIEKKIAHAHSDAVFSGARKARLANFCHVSFPGLDAERLVFLLEMKNVYVATGSACAANKGMRSAVLEAIGLAPEVADGSIRITLGRSSVESSTLQAIDILCEAVASEKQRIGAKR